MARVGKRGSGDRKAVSMVHKCNVCNMAFPKKFNLGRHQREVHEKRMDFKCQSCNQSFKRKEKLSAHLLLHKNAQHFECKKCGKAFTEAKLLQQHIKKKMKSKSKFHLYGCQKCKIVFRTKSGHSVHSKRTCPYIRPRCCLFCKFTPTTWDNTENHLRRHINERPFPCGACGKEFPSSGQRQQHEKNACRRDLINERKPGSVVRRKRGI